MLTLLQEPQLAGVCPWGARSLVCSNMDLCSPVSWGSHFSRAASTNNSQEHRCISSSHSPICPITRGSLSQSEVAYLGCTSVSVCPREHVAGVGVSYKDVPACGPDGTCDGGGGSGTVGAGGGCGQGPRVAMGAGELSPYLN